jgi:hypothetical protein
MARRNPPPRPARSPRALRPAAVAVVVALGTALAGAIAGPVGRADPAPALERARELYRSAEAAMNDGRYDDAARDYGAAYELSADPALFYKIGRASERGGKCDVAVVYYARYLREGKPTEPFTALTRERIAACGGAAPGPGDAGGPSGGAAWPAGAAGTRPAGGAPGPASSPGTAPAAGGAASGSAPSSASAASNAGPSSRPAASTGGAGAEPSAASPEGPAGAGPAADHSAAAAALIPPTREKVAWLMGGGALALVTLGGVLAYAASSSENDVRDLYAGFAGQPPMFDAQTRKRYDDLVDEGRSYQHLSWAAFGLAGAAAVGVAVLFTVGRHDEPAPAPAVTPVVGPRGAGVSVRF